MFVIFAVKRALEWHREDVDLKASIASFLTARIFGPTMAQRLDTFWNLEGSLLLVSALLSWPT